MCFSVSGKTDSKDTKVSLKTRVNGEATSGGVHTGNVLYIMDLFERHLDPVVPVSVVEVLSYQCVGLYRTVGAGFSLAFYRGVQHPPIPLIHPPFNSLNDMHTPFPLQ